MEQGLRRPSGIFRIAALSAVVATALLAGSALTGAESARQVWVVELAGPLGPATADLIIRSIDDAVAADAEALVIRMDTPGGLDRSMRDLVQAILAAEVPVVTFVAPGGARAASAGTYIAYASHIAAMAPATNIGSSTPVSIAPQPSFPTPEGPSGQDDGAAPPAEAPADAMTRKVVNDAVAYLQGIAELRGRNIEWAEATVREGANLRSSEALAQNVIDLISDDLPALLRDIDGREVRLAGSTRTLSTANASIRRVETDWRHDLLALITDPTIAYGLLIFGIYGLILEFYSPGMIFPSVIGIICLLLGAYGLQMLPVNYAGLALILVGIAMMIAEVFTPTFGVLGVAGLVAFVFGSVMLLDTETPGYQVPLSVIAAFAVATGGLTVFAISAAVRARGQPVRMGPETMIGSEARAIGAFTGHGSVRAFGEVWQAYSERPVAEGEHLTIRGLDGLTLLVEPVAESENHSERTH